MPDRKVVTHAPDPSFPPDEIETERLFLRRPRMTDADAIYQIYAADPDVARYLPWAPHASVEASREYLSRTDHAWECGDGNRAWAVESLGDKSFLGVIGNALVGYEVADIDLIFARAHWGCGYATEGLGAVLEVAFRDPSIYRASAVCDVDNQASARVLEKAGMQYEGRLRRSVIYPNISPEPRDTLLYARVR